MPGRQRQRHGTELDNTIWRALGWSLTTLPQALPDFKMAAKEEKISHLSEAGASYFRPCFTHPPICEQQREPPPSGAIRKLAVSEGVWTMKEGQRGGKKTQTTDRKPNTNPAGVGRGWELGPRKGSSEWKEGMDKN